MYLLPCLVATSIGAVLAASCSGSDCPKQVHVAAEEDWVSLLQLSNADRHVHKRSAGDSKQDAANNPFLQRAALVNKMTNLQTWFAAKMASMNASLAQLDAQYPGVANATTAGNATAPPALPALPPWAMPYGMPPAPNPNQTFWWQNWTAPPWYNSYTPPGYDGPVPAQYVPMAMQHGYNPWTADNWKWIVYGNIPRDGGNISNASWGELARRNPWKPWSNKTWHPYEDMANHPVGPWLPMVMTAKKAIEVKHEDAKKHLAMVADELAVLDAKYKELSASPESTTATAILDSAPSQPDGDAGSPLGLSASPDLSTQASPDSAEGPGFTGEDAMLDSMSSEYSPLGMDAPEGMSAPIQVEAGGAGSNWAQPQQAAMPEGNVVLDAQSSQTTGVQVGSGETVAASQPAVAEKAGVMTKVGAIPTPWINKAMAYGYDPVRDTQWKKMFH